MLVFNLIYVDKLGSKTLASRHNKPKKASLQVQCWWMTEMQIYLSLQLYKLSHSRDFTWSVLGLQITGNWSVLAAFWG